MKDYASVSLWLDTCGDDLTPRPSLDGDIDVDVAIVGAGYTGLWTAYYLLAERPSTRVAIVEREIAGFGASGRNGGWCSALFAAPAPKIAKRYGRGAAIAMQSAMFDSVDEVGRVCEREGIDAHFLKGGTLELATSPMQVQRVRGEISEARSWGLGTDDVRWLDAAEAARRVRTVGALGAAYTPHCARLHPACLARGLARVTEAAGATIYERTAARRVESGVVETDRGVVRAGSVVRATEGYTAGMAGHRRRLVPLYSLMIATEPLPSDVWDEIGWRSGETVTDGRHLLIYAQRTADDRIAIGGRGAPYHFGSRVDPRFDRDEDVFAELRRVLVSLWPATAQARITHRWGGPLGVPRDWFSSVGYSQETGVGWAGGYVGDGVSTANLAGRTLADLIAGRTTEPTRLPWVNHHSRSWEPEPLRWIGVNAGLRMTAAADRAETKTGRPSRRGALVKRLMGM